MAIFYLWGASASMTPSHVGNAQYVPDAEYDEMAKRHARDDDGFDVDELLRDGQHAWAGAFETPSDTPFDAGKDAALVKGSREGVRE